jgi:hypothetical protein
VAHPIQAVSEVRSACPRSAGIKRPSGVARGFKVSRYSVEPPKSLGTGYLLAKDNVRATLADEAEELGPEVALVIDAFPFARDRERLAGARAGPDLANV